MLSRFAPVAIVSSLALAAGCGSRVTVIESPTSVRLGDVSEASSSYVSPAHWAYLPRDTGALLAWRKMPDGRCVYAGEYGERFLVTPNKSDGTCEGTVSAAASLAPEDLVSIVERSDDSWFFVGRSGALYESRGPIEPFVRRVRPPERLARLVGENEALLAVGHTGKLYRWDEEASWEAVDVGGVPVGDVALASDGRALALGLPEQLFYSLDGGRSFDRANALASPPPTVGARRLTAVDDTTLAVYGAVETLVWDSSEPRFELSDVAEPEARETPALPSWLIRSPESVLRGWAALTGDRYVEAVRAYDIPGYEGDEDRWMLAKGGLEGPLETSRLPFDLECEEILLGAEGNQLIAACPRSTDRELLVEVWRSQDFGKRWKRYAELMTYDPQEIRIAVASDGTAVMTGVCSTDEELECPPSSIVTLTPKGDKAKIVVGRTPETDRLAEFPAISRDGELSYFIARRIKDDRLAIFVSADGGKTYRSRVIALPGVVLAHGEYEADPPPDPTYDRSQDLELDYFSRLTIDETGTLGLLMYEPDGPLYLTADREGHVVRAARPPTYDSLIGGVGARMLAVGYQAVDDPNAVPRPTAWESLDGGSTWTELPTTLALESRQEEAIVCAAGGCLAGDVVSRVGWSGQTGSFEAVLANDIDGRVIPTIRTPLVCELTDEPWRTISQSNGGQGPGDMPGTGQAYRGDSAWSAAVRSGNDEITVYWGDADVGSGRAKVRERRLLGPRANGSQTTHLSYQIEGYAAARATIPGSGEVSSIEVAWLNWQDGRWGERRLDGGGPAPAFQQHPGEIGMMSVSPGGLFVRPHGTPSRAKFVPVDGDVQELAYPDWSSLELDVEGGDAARVGSSLLPVGWLADQSGDAQGVVFAERVGDRWKLTPRALSPGLDADGVGGTMFWTYRGEQLGVISLFGSPDDGQMSAIFYPFAEGGQFGEPAPVPTPFDVSDAPRPCTKEEIATTPRFAAPLYTSGVPSFPGTRHPVVIIEPTALGAATSIGLALEAPMMLLTSGMVLHGTPSAPCARGWSASGLRGEELAAVIPADRNDKGWAMRRVGSGFEARPMTCKLDGNIMIPEMVWSEPGTHVTLP